MFVSFQGFSDAKAIIYQSADKRWYGQLTLMNNATNADPEHITINIGPKLDKEDAVQAVFEAAQDIMDSVLHMQLEESIKDKEAQEPDAKTRPDPEDQFAE